MQEGYLLFGLGCYKMVRSWSRGGKAIGNMLKEEMEKDKEASWCFTLAAADKGIFFTY